MGTRLAVSASAWEWGLRASLPLAVLQRVTPAAPGTTVGRPPLG